MMNFTSLKIEKKFNFSLQEDVYSLIGTLEDKEIVISSYETPEEAKAARVAVRSLMRMQTEQAEA